QRIARVQDDEGAERPREEHGVERREEEEAGGDAEGAAGQEPQEGAPVDVLAVAADDRGGGDDADQAPGGREDLHREDEREKRQADRAAEAEAAAQREGEEQHHDAVGELEGGEVVDQGVFKILRYLSTPLLSAQNSGSEPIKAKPRRFGL